MKMITTHLNVELRFLRSSISLMLLPIAKNISNILSVVPESKCLIADLYPRTPFYSAKHQVQFLYRLQCIQKIFLPCFVRLNSLYLKPLTLQWMSKQKTNLESKVLFIDFWDRIVLRHIYEEEDWNISAALRWHPSVLNGRASHPSKLKANNVKATLMELKVLYGEGRTYQKAKNLCRTPSNRPGQISAKLITWTFLSPWGCFSAAGTGGLL